MADTDGNHLAGAPFFGSRVGRFGKAFGFPFAAGQNACVFAGQINAGFLAETELRQIRRGFIDTHFIAETIEESIRRYLNGFTQVGRAVAAADRVAENMAAAGYAPCAGGGDDGVLSDFAAFQQSHAHKGFECRTRRIKALGNAVNQRLFPIVIQHFPSVAVDAVNKEIGIEGRLGNKSQNRTVLRIDGHQCATTVAQDAVGFLLHTDIHA